MDAWIDLARGPLFRISLAVCVLGLLYRLGIAVAQIVGAYRRAGDRRLPFADIATATLAWLVPLRLLRARPAYSFASLLFHVAILSLPLLIAGHVALLAGVLPSGWPTLPPEVADGLTLGAVVAVAALLVGRLASTTSRALSRFQDWAILVVLLGLVLAGFVAAHPALSPFGARSVLLAHILLGNLVLVLTPVSKIAHCILYPLTQLLFQLGWHFPAASGRHVAMALAKENEPV